MSVPLVAVSDGMMLCPTSQHRLDFFLTVPSTQCLETDKALLPCALDGSVFAAFDFIALLFQLLQKFFVVGGFLLQNFIDDTAQPSRLLSLAGK